MTGELVVCCENRTRAVAYLEALEVAGADGARLRLLTPEDRFESLDLGAVGAAADGLLLCGGPDLEPWRYGEKPLEGASLELLPRLDELEYGLLEGAREARTPVWAVCRGMQTVNVFLGGSLWQDIPLQLGNGVPHDRPEPPESLAHEVRVTQLDGPLASLLGAEPLPVNSRHHQAVRRLGDDLMEVGHSPDGLVEIVSHADPGWWLRGVQWHPENLMHMPLQRTLWTDFLAAASALDRGRESGRSSAGAGAARRDARIMRRQP